MGRKNPSFLFTESVLLSPGASTTSGPKSSGFIDGDADDIFNDPDAWSLGSGRLSQFDGQKPFQDGRSVFWETFDEDPSRMSVQAYPFLTFGKPQTRDDLALDLKKMSILFTPGTQASHRQSSLLSPLTFPSPVTPGLSTGFSRATGRTTFTPLSSSSIGSARPMSCGPVSASATWSILRMYGIPETPRSGSSRKSRAAEWHHSIPPVPPLPPPLRPPTPDEEKETDKGDEDVESLQEMTDVVILAHPTPPARSRSRNAASPNPPRQETPSPSPPSRASRPLPAVPQQARSLPAIPMAATPPPPLRRAASLESPVEHYLQHHQHSQSLSYSQSLFTRPLPVR